MGGREFPAAFAFCVSFIGIMGLRTTLTAEKRKPVVLFLKEAAFYLCLILMHVFVCQCLCVHVYVGRNAYVHMPICMKA